MKRFLSLLLALTLALALAIPASADAYGYTVDGKDVGIIGSADGPTFILVGEDLEADTVDGKDVDIIGSADSPTFILVREDSEADAEATAQVFDLLLGDNLQGRKDHIAENGYKYLELADIS